MGVILLSVHLKFGYDHINISYRNGLLKNTSNPSKICGHKKQMAKLNDLVFIINGEISSRRLVVLLVGGIVVVTDVSVIVKFGYDPINIFLEVHYGKTYQIPVVNMTDTLI